MIVNIIFDCCHLISGFAHGTVQELLVLADIFFCNLNDLLNGRTAIQMIHLQIQPVLSGKTILLKQLPYHIGKNKFHIHGRKLGIGLIFGCQAAEMAPQLLHILSGNIF